MRRLAAIVLVLGLASCVREVRPARRPSALEAEGLASWYGPGLQGRKTANGETFDKRALTAAHRTLPFGTCVIVRDLDTNREVAVRINDRGPYAGGRIIDVSEAAAEKLGMIDRGVARVRLRACD